MSIARIVVALAAWLVAGAALAESDVSTALTPETARFHRLGVDGGLPQTTVRAIAEDPDGFVWLGTQDGLARFDGYDVRTFRREQGLASSLVNSQVTAIAVADGEVWAATQGGLSRYRAAQETFENYRHDPHDPHSIGSDFIYTMLVARDGTLWIGHANGFARWRAATRDFESFVPGPKSSGTESPVFALAEERGGRIWLGTNEGLLGFDPKHGKIEAVAALHDVQVRSLLVDRNQRLWIGTEGEGLFRYDAATGTLQRLGSAAEGEPVSGRIHTLLEDRDGRLWVGTETALDLSAQPEAAEPKWVRFTHRRNDPYGLGSGRVTAAVQGRDQTLWFGTWTGGLSWIGPGSGRFLSFGPDVAATSALRDGSIQAMRAEEPSTVWLGSRDGIYRFDVTASRLELVAGTAGMHVTEIVFDGDDLLVGTNHGLVRMPRHGGVATRVPLDPTLDLTRVVQIHRDGRWLWVGTVSPGLAIVDTTGKEPIRQFAMPNVRVIEPFDADRMLVGSSTGLYWFTRESPHLLLHQANDAANADSLPFDFVTAWLRRSDGSVWLGTQGGGLLGMQLAEPTNPASARFRSFTRADGLAADAIGAMAEARDGRLWLSTTRGISSFDPQSGRFENYDSGDGAFDTGYYIGSGARLASGAIAFGGLEGITVFNPDRLSPAPAPPNVLLTDLQIGARRVGARSADVPSPLDSALYLSKSLSLPPDAARDFRLRFAAPYPAAPQQLRFAHRLDGFDDDWIESGPTQRLVTYTNLAPGDYRFRVKAVNRDRVWSPAETTLAIRVLPRWWQSTPARVLFALLAAAALYGAYRWRVSAIAQHRRKLQQRVAERTADLLTLGEIGRELTATLEPREAFERLYGRVSPLLDAHVFSIGIYDAASDAVRSEFAIEGGELLPARVFAMSEHNRPAVWCVRHRRELTTATNSQLTDYVETILPVARGAAMESIVYLPLIAHDRVLGFLSVQSPRQAAYSSSHLDFLRTLASYTAIALSNAQTFGRLKEAMATLQHTQEQLLLNEKLAATGQLTAGVAHEINNPTNFAYVAAQNLEVKLARFHAFLRELAGPDAEPEILQAIDARVAELDEQLSTILEGNRRVAGIVQDLRTFSRLGEAERKRVSIVATLNSTLSLIGISYRHEAHITTRFDGDPQIDCIPARVNQVFMNLIVNACHAISERRRQEGTAFEGRLAIHCSADDAEVSVVFDDNGVGIDEATRKRIFEPFFTTKPVGEGQGLGLSVSYGIVRDHGGRIDVESTPGVGSRFTVVLPLPTTVPVTA